MSTIPIPLPFEKGRDLPPHLTSSNQYYDSSSSPSASSSSTPIPHNPALLPSKLQQPLLSGEDQEDPSAGQEDEENIFRDMSWEEILEDLNARFLINLPREEMSLVRVYWQAEQAHWFYEDYLRPLNPLLPSLSQRNFTRVIIESSPLYASLMAQGGVDYDQVWEEYCSYKRMVPCCGGILINKDGDKCLMVRGFKSNAGWSFPRGKINLEESEVACAVREVEEETGFDLTGLIHEPDKIKTHINAQEVTMFIVKGIDENTVFETQTRNEIGAIDWVKLSDLPTWINKRGPKRTGGNGQKKFYNVTPFVTPLKHWLKEHGIDPYMKPKKKGPSHNNTYRDLQPYQFDSPSPQPASPIPSRGSSTLDAMFARFLHKQEEELAAPNQQAVVGSDAKAGLERLFGNLNVLKEEEEESLHHRTEAGLTDQERYKKEDSDLARLLGGIGIAQTPAPEPPKPAPSTQKQSHLLSLLNARPSASSAQPPASPVKPHQVRLLSVISPQAPSAQITPTPAKPMSLPTSPCPASTSDDAEETQRQAKARALLDMTIAGIGIDVPANSTHQMDTLSSSHSAFLPPLPQPSSRGTGSTSGTSGSTSLTRITPPTTQANMPPLHQPPPSTYTNNQGYRPNTQPPLGGYTAPRPPTGPMNPAQNVYGSPNRSAQPPPPPHEPSSRTGSGPEYPYSGNTNSGYMANGPNAHQPNANAIPAMVQNRPPAMGPGFSNVQNSSGFRPTSNPLPPPGTYGNYGNNGPHPPHHHLPPSGLQGGFVHPPPHNLSVNVNQPYQPRPPNSMGVNMPPGATYHQHQQQNFPPNSNVPPQHAVPAYNTQRGSPPRFSHVNNPNPNPNPNVFHPVPRPPQGQGAALLAMINGNNQQGR
ncbi:uncharacterized protein I303_100688 [Kwoniella dejecticola CBS 10117]|uniref:Nudix hydrolase domain-containing protein n=1 Tax=Kwoniella dejecticola CBS 10117 TaxID=1296121 RepID=A0A1A6AFM9_9TREE|nr:uncharacterized protein I303_00692 [Kwoniella dejecticola CBS 10117]OBR88875.1 hypothetical protein I303_00692 [Kwoniella dejecticola CBS 10117]